MKLRHRLLSLTALAAAALAAPGAARADAAPADASSPVVETRPPHEFHPLVGVLFTGTISPNPQGLTNPDGSTATSDMGQRFEAFVGFDKPVTRGGLSVRLTAGIHSGPVSTPAGGERFVTFPLEASLLYAVDDSVRLGAGAHYAMRLRFTGPGGNSSDSLNGVPSGFAYAELKLLPHLWLDARWVQEYFEQTSVGQLDTGHWGLGIVGEY